MPRSIQEGPVHRRPHGEKVEELNRTGSKRVVRHGARSTITPDFVGHTLAVLVTSYPGLRDHMVGHKLGSLHRLALFAGTVERSRNAAAECVKGIRY